MTEPEDYLLEAQINQVLRPINPARVSARDGNSYVQAFEVKAHMARIFGICRWSSEVIEQRQIVEREVTTKAGKPAWQVGYHSIVKITVHSPNGTYLATYTEGHAGGSTHPDLIEAHGGAITNSESYAFKRAATMALLDQGGLSLYGQGSKKALVGRTVLMPAGPRPESEAIDAHITDAVAEERDTDSRPEPAAPTPEPRTTSSARQPVQVGAVTAELQKKMDAIASRRVAK